MSDDDGGMSAWLAKDGAGALLVNGERMEVAGYVEYHRQRMAFTLQRLRRLGSRRVLEVGGHPWVMTACLAEDPVLELCATVSAAEVSEWPDDIPLKRCMYRMATPGGREVEFPNYSANIERRLFDVAERPEVVTVCEIIEHLIRSPHVMFLNINRWLPIGGLLFLTTPKALSLPTRYGDGRGPRRTATVYERHHQLYTLDQLVDLIGLCGFQVREAGYCNVNPRRGAPALYPVLARMPGRYSQEKFCQTIFVLAEKTRDVAVLSRHPVVYDSRGRWEFIESRGQSDRGCGNRS